VLREYRSEGKGDDAVNGDWGTSSKLFGEHFFFFESDVTILWTPKKLPGLDPAEIIKLMSVG